jgi:death-on-curing protein
VTTLYPTVEEVLFLHRRLIERFGGSAGFRDLGLLESALGRARSGYYPALSEQAAALLQSLSRNHPFVDGNKRVAFATTAVFLRLNGYALVCTADEAERFLVGDVITSGVDVQTIAAQLEGWMQAV